MVKDAKVSNTVALRCKIVSEISVRHVRNLSIIAFEIADTTGKVKVTYFNQPYLRNTLKKDHYYIFRGLLKQKGNNKLLEQPKIYEEQNYFSLEGTMQPRYSLVKGLSNNTIVKAVQKGSGISCIYEDELPEYITKKI